MQIAKDQKIKCGKPAGSAVYDLPVKLAVRQQAPQETPEINNNWLHLKYH